MEVASEYRYRDQCPRTRKTLVVTISQSGETADTLAALQATRASLGMRHTLTICNVATSAMVRECQHAYITRAGVEIGVASAPRHFTTQLAALFLLTLVLAQTKRQTELMRKKPMHLKATAPSACCGALAPRWR